MIPFADWVPDAADLGNPGTVDAKNVLPAPVGYLPWPSVQAYSNALDARCQGMFYARAKDGTTYIYAGDSAKLYSLSTDTFSDASKSGGYAVGADERWEFTKWGEKVVAVCGVNQATTNAPQIITLGDANWADLTTAPPQARHVATMRNHVVVGNTWDSGDGLVPNRVRWCAASDETDWVASAATLAGFNDIQTGGWVQRVVGGEYGLVFMDYAIWRMSYVGSPLVWQFDEVLRDRGTPAPGSVSRFGDLTFFLSQQGFEVVIAGSDVQPIGATKVDRYFFDDLDAFYQERITSAIDPIRQRVYWAYPGVGHTNGVPNRVLCYDWSLQRWSYSDQVVQYVAPFAQPSYTLDQLDNITTDLDALPVSLDSRIWAGDAPVISVFNADNKLGFWTGTPLTSAVTTKEVQITQGQRTSVSRVRPLVDGGTTTVRVGSRNRQQDAVTWKGPYSVTTSGDATLRSNARYHRFKLESSGEYTEALGVEITGAQPSGGR